MAPRKNGTRAKSKTKPEAEPRNSGHDVELPADEAGAPSVTAELLDTGSNTKPETEVGSDNETTPTMVRIATRSTNAAKHPGDPVKQYTRKRRTKEEMEEDRRLNDEMLERVNLERQQVLTRLAVLEKQLQEAPEFGATPVAVPASRRLRRTETYIGFPPTTSEANHRMEVDEPEGEEPELKAGTEEEVSELEDNRRKKKPKTASTGQEKGKIASKIDIDSVAKDAKEQGEGVKEKRRRKNPLVREAIDEVREQLDKVRHESEIDKIDKQGEGGIPAESADTTPKRYVP